MCEYRFYSGLRFERFFRFRVNKKYDTTEQRCNLKKKRLNELKIEIQQLRALRVSP